MKNENKGENVSKSAAKGQANNSGLKKDFTTGGTGEPKKGSIDKNMHGDMGSRGGQ